MSKYCKKCGFPSDFLIDGMCKECYKYEVESDSYNDEEDIFY